jgi:translation initiation factor IF-2
VQSGALNKGDIILSGGEFGRVRAMIDSSGNEISSSVGPSTPVEVLGLSGIPNAGDEMIVVPDEKKAREIAELRQNKSRESKMAKQHAVKLQNAMNQMSEGNIATLNVLVKADVQGSSEAIVEALTRLSTDEVRVSVVSSGVGGITETDMNLAHASKTVVIGFNVRADASARKIADEEEIEIRYYSIIYDLIDDVKAAMSGMLTPELREEIIGIAEVKDVFRSPKFGDIAGCIVSSGSVKKHNPIRVLRDNIVIYEGELESLRRFKDDVNEVKSGTECGIGVKNYNNVQPGDQIEVFERIEIARTI